MTCIRKLWVLSINKTQVVYSRFFPLMEQKALKNGYSGLKGVTDDKFAFGVFRSLGLDRLCETMDPDAFHNEEFDDLQQNQMPVLKVRAGDIDLWPILVSEHSGMLFCVMPLIKNPEIEDVSDMIEVSTCLSLIQELTRVVTSEQDFYKLEELYLSIMPLGQYLVCNETSSKPLLKSDQSSVIKIQIDEKILPQVIETDDFAHGTITISNTHSMNENAKVIIQRPDLMSHDILVSQGCSVESNDCITIELSNNLEKNFHFILNSKERRKMFTHIYKMKKPSPNLYKFELVLEVPKHLTKQKYSFFNVCWRDGFTRGVAKLTKSDLSHGSLTLEPERGLIWMIGSKFPSNGKAVFSGQFESSNPSIDVTTALVTFKIDNHHQNFFGIARSNISFTPQVRPDSKLLVVSTLVGTDIKLIPNFE